MQDGSMVDNGIWFWCFLFFQVIFSLLRFAYPPLPWLWIAPLWTEHLFNVYGVCAALAYLSIGLVMTKLKMTIKWNVLFPIALLAFALVMLENKRALSVSMLPLSAIVFVIVYKFNQKISQRAQLDKDFFLARRNESTIIYFTHPLFIQLTCLWMPVSTILGWVTCVVLCMISAYLIVKIRNIKGFGWLGYLM